MLIHQPELVQKRVIYKNPIISESGVEQPRDFKLLLSKGKLVQSSTNISEHSEPGDRQQHPAKKTYLLDLKKE
jgi:hypothetical protein